MSNKFEIGDTVRILITDENRRIEEFQKNLGNLFKVSIVRCNYIGLEGINHLWHCDKFVKVDDKNLKDLKIIEDLYSNIKEVIVSNSVWETSDGHRFTSKDQAKLGILRIRRVEVLEKIIAKQSASYSTSGFISYLCKENAHLIEELILLEKAIKDLEKCQAV